jgi:hypothetical protein
MYAFLLAGGTFPSFSKCCCSVVPPGGVGGAEGGGGRGGVGGAEGGGGRGGGAILVAIYEISVVVLTDTIKAGILEWELWIDTG